MPLDACYAPFVFPRLRSHANIARDNHGLLEIRWSGKQVFANVHEPFKDDYRIAFTDGFPRVRPKTKEQMAEIR